MDDEDELEDDGSIDVPPPGITAWSVLWNVVSFFAAFWMIVAQFWRNVACDIAAQDRSRRERKSFQGSVTQGIEALMDSHG